MHGSSVIPPVFIYDVDRVIHVGPDGVAHAPFKIGNGLSADREMQDLLEELQGLRGGEKGAHIRDGYEKVTF